MLDKGGVKTATTEVEKNAIKWELMNIALDTIGIYPAAIIKNGVETKRTDWQDGWNAGHMAVFEAMDNIERFFTSLDEEVSGKLIKLSNDGFIFFHVDENKNVNVNVNCSDVFYLSCADCERIGIEEINNLWDMCYDADGNERRYGGDIWCILRRKQKPCNYFKDKLIEHGLWNRDWGEYE